MKKFFENDRSLKLVAVIIAIMLWLYFIIILDPAVDVTVRELPIQFLGEETLHENGLSVVSESETDITLKVRGSRKKMGRFDMKSIIATVDISSVSEAGTTTLPVNVVIPFENQGISAQDPYTVDVKVEPMVEKALDIAIKTEGSLANDYMAGPMSIENSQIKITGPESVVGKIGSAAVVLNYGNADVDIDKNLPVRLYGTDGKEILASDAIRSRIRTDINQTVLHCKVVKLRKVKIIPVFDFVEEGQSISAKLEPEVVQIYGEEQVTSKIQSIYTQPISMEKLTSNQKTKVKLEIPEGVKILQDITEVEVTLLEEKENG